MVFWPPATAGAADIIALKEKAVNGAAELFSTPEFVAAYGQPEVVGAAVEPAVPTLHTMQLAVGLAVGLGGALLLGVVAMQLLRRRRAGTTGVQYRESSDNFVP